MTTMNEQAPEENTEPPAKNKRRNGLLIFAALVAVAAFFAYRPPVTAVYCETIDAPERPDAIMLATPWCPYCYQARKYFLHNNISYCEYNVEDGSKGEQMYTEINQSISATGMPLGVPILFIGDYTFSGFEKARIEQALAALNPAQTTDHDLTH